MLVDGQLLQTNKRWDQLSMKQRELITGWMREEYFRVATEGGRVPYKGDKEGILDRVQARIDERGIWIPAGEIRKRYESRIARFRKSLLKLHPELAILND